MIKKVFSPKFRSRHEHLARAALTSVLISSLVSLPLPVSAFVLMDATFDNSDWFTTKLMDTSPDGAASATNSQLSSGGNPEFYRQTIHNWQTTEPGVGIRFGHIYTGSSYNPGTEGAIASLSFSLDAILTLAPHVNGRSLSFLVEQSGVFFRSTPTRIRVNTGWNSIGATLTSLDLLSFDGFSNPDFSDFGDPLQFGYVTGNGGSGAVLDLENIGGVDNWSVTLTKVPVPASFLLMLFAFPVLYLFRANKAIKRSGNNC